MAAIQLQAHKLSRALSSSSSSCRRTRVRASLHAPINPGSRRDIPRLHTTMTNMDTLASFTLDQQNNTATNKRLPVPAISNGDDVISMLYAIADAAADRANMHAIIGQQRDNWAHLLLTSINSITLSASLMAGISAIPVAGSAHVLAFKLSSALLFAAAGALMSVTNKIQPSQLAEEQRNSDRLFRRLEKSIHTTIAIGAPTEADVEEAMEKVLALDKAYPLPLHPGMIEKFPETVQPTVWWPKQTKRRQRRSNATANDANNNNGWSEELESEMRTILGVLKRKDTKEYLSTGEVVVKINRVLAVLGPLLAGVAAVGAGLVGTPGLGALPALVGVVGGAAVTVVNTLEHGGQLGMLFELLRNCAGFYREAEVEIEGNLKERELDRRENGEIFELKMALRLGRSLSEMKALAATAAAAAASSSSSSDEFAGKLF